MADPLKLPKKKRGKIKLTLAGGDRFEFEPGDNEGYKAGVKRTQSEFEAPAPRNYGEAVESGRYSSLALPRGHTRTSWRPGGGGPGVLGPPKLYPSEEGERLTTQLREAELMAGPTIAKVYHGDEVTPIREAGRTGQQAYQEAMGEHKTRIGGRLMAAGQRLGVVPQAQPRGLELPAGPTPEQRTAEIARLQEVVRVTEAAMAPRTVDDTAATQPAEAGALMGQRVPVVDMSDEEYAAAADVLIDARTRLAMLEKGETPPPRPGEPGAPAAPAAPAVPPAPAGDAAGTVRTRHTAGLALPATGREMDLAKREATATGKAVQLSGLRQALPAALTEGPKAGGKERPMIAKHRVKEFQTVEKKLGDLPKTVAHWEQVLKEAVQKQAATAGAVQQQQSTAAYGSDVADRVRSAQQERNDAAQYVIEVRAKIDEARQKMIEAVGEENLAFYQDVRAGRYNVAARKTKGAGAKLMAQAPIDYKGVESHFKQLQDTGTPEELASFYTEHKDRVGSDRKLRNIFGGFHVAAKKHGLERASKLYTKAKKRPTSFGTGVTDKEIGDEAGIAVFGQKGKDADGNEITTGNLTTKSDIKGDDGEFLDKTDAELEQHVLEHYNGYRKIMRARRDDQSGEPSDERILRHWMSRLAQAEEPIRHAWLRLYPDTAKYYKDGRGAEPAGPKKPPPATLSDEEGNVVPTPVAPVEDPAAKLPPGTRTATNPTTGEKTAFIDGKWVPIK